MLVYCAEFMYCGHEAAPLPHDQLQLSNREAVQLVARHNLSSRAHGAGLHPLLALQNMLGLLCCAALLPCLPFALATLPRADTWRE